MRKNDIRTGHRKAELRKAERFAKLGRTVRSSVQALEQRVLFSAFQNGDIAVYRVGDGTSALTTTSAPVFVDEYSPTGTFVQSIPLPTSAGGGNNPLTAAGTGTFEGFITTSQNGQNLLVTGYDAAPNTARIAITSSGATAPVTSGTITAGPAATPLVITVNSSTGMANGQAITITNIGTASAGTYFVQITATTNKIALYNDAALTSPVVGSGTFVTGGTWSDTAITTTPREVGVISATGAINTTTTLGTALSALAPAGAVSIDGSTNAWVAGANGVYYTTIGSTSTATSLLTAATMHTIEILNGQLYIDQGTSTAAALGTLGGVPAPTTGPATFTNLTGAGTFTSGAGLGGGEQFAFATLNPADNFPDTLYVADNGNDGVDKFTLTGSTNGVGGTWTITGEIGSFSTGSKILSGITGLVAEPVAGGEQLFMTVPGAIYSVVDPYGFNSAGPAGNSVFSASPALTTVATTASNEAFRGIALAPQPATVSITSSPSPVTAIAGTNAMFTATANGVNQMVQWQVKIGAGSFTNISDGSLYSGTATDTLTVLSTTPGESGEQFRAVFSNSTPSTATSGAATLTVNAIPQVSVDMTNYTVNENAGTATVNVDLTFVGTLTTPITVNYATANGTGPTGANAGTNYTAESSPPNAAITFTQGGPTQIPITIPISAVYPQGGNKTFTLTLTNPQGDGAILGNATATVQIVDVGEIFSFSGSSYTVNDNNLGGNAEITIVRTGPLTDTDTVNFTYGGTAGTPVSFAAGQQVGVATIPVNVMTGDQSVPLIITGGSAGTGHFLTGSITSATLTVVDANAAAFTNNLSGAAAAESSIETTGFATNSGFGSISADPNPHPLIYGIADFTKTNSPDLYPIGGSTVNSISNLSLQLYNTAQTGTFGGVVGNFNIYVIPDTTTNVGTGNTSVKFIATGGSTGTGLEASEFNPATVQLLGTFSFNNDTVGDDTFSADGALNAAAVTTLKNALNSDANIRLAYSPVAIGTGGMFADWSAITTSSGTPPMFSISAVLSATPVTFSIDTTATQTYTKGTNTFATITVDRSLVQDPASFQYYTTDGSGVSGVDYTGTSISSPATVTFPVGQTQATFTIPLLNNTSIFGDKNFTVTIENPMVTSAGFAAGLGTPSSELVTVIDPRTSDLLENAGLTGTFEPSGPSASDGTKFFDIVNANAGATASYGVADYNVDGNNYVIPAGTTVAAINALTFYTVNAPFSATASGAFDVYMVAGASFTTLATSGLKFNTNPATGGDAVQGIDTSADGLGQLGQAYLLGSFNYSATQPSNQFTAFTLSPSAAASSLLASDLNSSSPFRIVVTPEDSAVGATFDGINIITLTGIQSSDNPGDAAPMIGINYTPGVVSSVPAWIDPATPTANYSWSESAQTLQVNGNVHIIADPSASGDDPVITTTGTPVITVDVADTGSTVQLIHFGGLTLSSGASMIVDGVSGRTSSVHDAVIIPSGGAFSIGTSSTLDLTSNDLILSGAGSTGLTTVNGLLSSGYTGNPSGAWKGTTGIISSTAAGNTKSDTGLADVLGPASGTFDGQTVGANDVVVKYTYFGDDDLSGTITSADYIAIDNGFNSSAKGWQNGDFNYDGKINGDDYALIDNAYNTQGSTASPLSVVAASPQAATAPAKTASVFATGAPIPASDLTGSVSSVTDGVFDDGKKSLADEVLG